MPKANKELDNIGAEWPFDQPENCAVFSTRQVMLENAAVLLVLHDEDDHSWQFLTGGDLRMADAMLVSLKNAEAKDATLFELADLPPGWQARRNTRDASWLREKIVSTGQDDDL